MIQKCCCVREAEADCGSRMVSNAEKKRKCRRTIPDVTPLGVVGLLNLPARELSVFGGDMEDDAVERDDEAGHIGILAAAGGN
jgi:hypothetical protein